MTPEPFSLTPDQQQIAWPIHSPRTFLTGIAGSGKTTAAVERLYQMLINGIPADQILVLTPQRSLAAPYRAILKQPDIPPGGRVDILTLNGLAQHMIRLFWPLVAKSSGFSRPSSSPNFLTIETAQYYMAAIVEEKRIQEGYFAAITIDPNRLYSQILDNMNKAALVGFSYNEIADRLKSAWSGPSSQLRVYDQAQECMRLFRLFCLENQLLDYSLQMEVFIRELWPSLLCRQYLLERYHHLIADNLEEDTPTTHDILREWLPTFETALLISDTDGGFRKFLGADPVSASSLAETCDERIEFTKSFQLPAALEEFISLTAVSMKVPPRTPPTGNPIPSLRDHLEFQTHHFYPQLLDWCADTIRQLVDGEQAKPGEIAVVAPFMPDTVRFSLTQRLREQNLDIRTIRPSRSLRDEPLVRCLITLAKLAHPDWDLGPHPQDVITALHQSIQGLDLVRATLLGRIVYRRAGGKFYLSDYNQIKPEERSQITYQVGEKYERLRGWLEIYQQDPVTELDIFFRRLFGELLSQPGFHFHTSPEAGEVTANFIESAAKFRQNIEAVAINSEPIGKEFIRSVENGLISAQYQRHYGPLGQEDDPSIILEPAHTYLMQNEASRYQIWLDIGSNGWWERLEQPLTHPYVLSRSWENGKRWTDAEEYATNQASMYRLSTGLLRRCTRKAFLGYVEINEQGYSLQGEMLKAFQTAAIKAQYLPDQENGDSPAETEVSHA
jgi:hypothetical protein